MCYWAYDRNETLFWHEMWKWLDDGMKYSLDIHDEQHNEYFKKLENGENVDNFFKEWSEKYETT